MFPEKSRVVQDYHFLEDNLAGIVPVETIVCFNKSTCEELNILQRMELVREIQQRISEHPEISGTLSLADFQPVIHPPATGASFFEHARYGKRANLLESRLKTDKQNASRAFLTVANNPAQFQNAKKPFQCQPGDELWRITAQVAILTELDYGNLTSELNEITSSVLKKHAGAGHLITGTIPLFLRTQQAVLESLVRSFALAFGVIAIVMIVLLRNLLAGLISMIPNVAPVGIVFGLISWNHLAVDIGSMITASVALGIAVDGTLHLLTWFRTSLIEGYSRRNAVIRAMTHCGPAMWQTSAAVGIGLLMLYPAELLLISRFGWLMAAMIGAALACDLVLLPALLAGPLGGLIERTIARQQSQLADQSKNDTNFPQPHLPDVASKPGILEPVK